MTANFNAIIDELKRLQGAGVDRVFVSDQTLAALIPKADQERSSLLVDKAPSAEAPDEVAQKKAEQQDDRNLPEPSSATSTAKVSVNTDQVRAFPQPPVIALPDVSKAEQMAWLKNKVLSCKESISHLRPGGKLVFGEGPINADLCFVGEAPGADEERVGRPFVGEAGQLLEKIIKAADLQRERLYITNILTWRPQHPRPTGNRPPTDQEMKFCLPYLLAQLDIVKPKVIVALGNSAVNGLLGVNPKRRLSDVRGTWQSFNGTPLMVTFHPSYLLRNGTLRTKRAVWEDMLAVLERLELPITERQRGFFLPKS